MVSSSVIINTLTDNFSYDEKSEKKILFNVQRRLKSNYAESIIFRTLFFFVLC